MVTESFRSMESRLARVLGVEMRPGPREMPWFFAWRVADALGRAIDDGRRVEVGSAIQALASAREVSPLAEVARVSSTMEIAERWGGFRTAPPPIELERNLTEAALGAWVRGETNLVRVRRYADVPERVISRLRALPMTLWTYGDSDHRVATDVMTIGVPAQTITSEDARRAYYAQDFEVVRRVWSPNLSPLDRLRLDLDSFWPDGATVRGGSDGGRRLAGIVRSYMPSAWRPPDGLGPVPRGADGYLHIDGLASDRESLLSANIYLDVPESGGELLYYNIAHHRFRITDTENCVWEFLRNLDVYRILVGSLFDVKTIDPEVQARVSDALPDPLRLRPCPGDLLLINPSVPHSVRDIEVGRRLSIQSFLRVRPDVPIRMLA